MSQTLEVRTSHREVADVVRELAPFFDDTSVRLPAGRRIADGEWVRFTVHLVDGSAVLEGVGRCQESTQEGASTYRVRLSLLSFDERNEIMFERICLASDGSSAATGTIDVRQLRERILKPPPSSPSKSVPPPPPPPPRQLARKQSAMPPPLKPRPRTARPPAPSRPPGRSGTKNPAPRPDTPRHGSSKHEGSRPPALGAMPRVPSIPRAPTLPRPSSFPPPGGSSFPAAPRTPSAPTRSRPPPSRSAPAKPRVEPVAATERPPPMVAAPSRPPLASLAEVRRDRPKAPAPARSEIPPARLKRAIPRAIKDRDALAATAERVSPTPPAVEDATPESVTLDTVVGQPADLIEATHSGLRLEVSARLVEQARALAPNLPTGLLRKNPVRETPEEAVLKTALRLGMASLAALSDTDDEP